MKTIEYQKHNIERLLKLKNENPELEVVPMVNSEVVASDEFNSWIGGWSKVEIDEIYCTDERIYLRSDDEEHLIEGISDFILLNNGDISEEQAYESAKNEVYNYKWRQVIVVRIGLPY